MKKIILITIVYLCCCFIISCRKDKDEPTPTTNAGANINGIWLGKWYSDSLNGSFIYNAVQDGIDFTGDISIVIENDGSSYNRECYGSIIEKKVSASVSVANYNVTAVGVVDGDTSVSGTFSVPQLNMSGTFDGKKHSSTNPTLYLRYSKTAEMPFRISQLVAIDTRIWAFIYPPETGGSKVWKFDTYFSSIDSVLFPTPDYCAAYDGDCIWFYQSGGEFQKYSTDGQQLSSFVIDIFAHNFICDSSFIYAPLGFNKLVKLSHTGLVADTINLEYVSVYQSCLYQDKILAMDSKMAFLLSKEGRLLEVYPMPEDFYVIKITSNGNKIWVMTEQYNTSSTSTEFKIYEMVLN